MLFSVGKKKDAVTPVYQKVSQELKHTLAEAFR